MKFKSIVLVLVLSLISTCIIPTTSMALEEPGYPLCKPEMSEGNSKEANESLNNGEKVRECQVNEIPELELHSTTSSQNIDGYKFRRVDNLYSTHTTWVNRWGEISPVQQFLYKDQGLAYAYVDDTNLHIVTPKSEFITEMKYPILGDVISDNDGNFYVVWGKNNTEDIYSTQTVFITKYTNEGKHVKTTGFVGKSVMGDTGNTKQPFRHGGCDSVISNGYLMVNYARTMYNGHQSNNVVGVRIDNMSAVEFSSVWDIPYTSHSFNQKLIWSELANDFVYADHGDAYGRGFIITVDGEEKNLFHFYLQSNANYDMYIVNETFAQLGGLAENSKGVVLAGASVKTIGENAKNEKQNLFVQIFNPTASRISASMFVGGQERNGETSFDINDNENSPLEPITDYGVHWLTNYTDKNVVAPQMVVCDDKVVLLWSTDEYDDSAYYMILSNTGEVLVPVTKIPGVYLNSYEDPICYNGEIYWAYSYGEAIRVVKLGEILKGDLHTDGFINTKDSVKLTQYLAKWNITLTDEEKNAADVVVDGFVNSKDSIKLAQYLAKWNVSLE